MLHVCLRRHHESSVHSTNTKLGTSCNLEPGRASTTDRLLGPVAGVQAVSVFPKDTTIQCPVQEPNRESTTLQLPTCALIHKVQR